LAREDVEMPETKKASCLFCSLQCGFGMEMGMDLPIRVDLDTEARANEGRLCARGHYNFELLLHPKRFLSATVNRRRVPLSSGVTKIGGKLAELKGAGGDAVGMILSTELSNEDYDAAVSFAGQVLGTTNIAVAYDGGDYPLLMGGGAGTASPEDLDDADAFLLVGDVFWGHPTIAKRIITARHSARANRIYTINPFRTNTDWFADGHIEVPPDGEPVALAAILKAMKAGGNVDMAKACSICGTTAKDFEQVGADLKGKEKVVVVVSSRFGDSTAAYLTGKLAKAIADAAGGKYAPFFRGGNAVGAFRRVGSTKTVPDILKGVSTGKTKGLLVFGPDILQLYPGAVSADELEKLDLLAASAIFENDVTKHSDAALPQAVWTEMDGTYDASLGITNTIAPMAPPKGDGRTVAQMLETLARELDVTLRTGEAKAEHPEPGIDADAAVAAMLGDRGKGLVFIENTHPLHRWDGTITGRMSFPQAQKPYCDVWVSETDAEKLGIEQGSTVALASERGETRIIVTVTDRMPDGVVAVPSYVPDARGLFEWKPNATTRWYDVTAVGAKVGPEE
jgi:predicted molibdopterin-dependent oxidoreductase YjgC